jgi:hypothetical protein
MAAREAARTLARFGHETGARVRPAARDRQSLAGSSHRGSRRDDPAKARRASQERPGGLSRVAVQHRRQTWTKAPPSLQATTVLANLQVGVVTMFRHRSITKTGPGDWSPRFDQLAAAAARASPRHPCVHGWRGARLSPNASASEPGGLEITARGVHVTEEHLDHFRSRSFDLRRTQHEGRGENPDMQEG